MNPSYLPARRMLAWLGASPINTDAADVCVLVALTVS